MKTKFSMKHGNICLAEEEAIIVPCSTKPGYCGSGVDRAVFSVFPEVFEQWRNMKEPPELGKAVAIEAYNKVFIMTAVPPMKPEKNGKPHFDNELPSLDSCLVEALDIAEFENCNSVAAPLIGSGELKWPLSECFFSIQTVVDNNEFFGIYCPKFTLYLLDDKAVELAQANNWELERCVTDVKIIKDRIDYLRGFGYERNESNSLLGWFYEKAECIEKERPNSSISRPSPAEILAERIEQRFEKLTQLRGKKVKNTDIVRLSGLTENAVGQLRKGNPQFKLTKDKLIALGAALCCGSEEVSEWLGLFGMVFVDSPRDELIRSVLSEGKELSAAEINAQLLDNGHEQLNESELDRQRRDFKVLVDRQFDYLTRNSGETFTNITAAERSGLTVNTLSEIRRASKKFVPEKDKIIALSLALHCYPHQLEAWLSVFGMSVTKSDRDKLIMNVFTERKKFDVFSLNYLLTSKGFQCLQVTNPVRFTER